jgi:hypothetical protein
VEPRKKDAKSERAGMGVGTAGCLDLVVVILSHAKVEPMPFSINAWCMLGTHARYGGWLSRPRRLSVDEEDIAAADAGTTRSKLWTRLQKSERVCGESG